MPPGLDSTEPTQDLTHPFKTVGSLRPEKGRKTQPIDQNELGQFNIDPARVKAGSEHRTSVMIRNVPGEYTADQLIEELGQEGISKFDFFYLPRDLRSKKKRNLGYAFVNFLHPFFAVDLFQKFNNRDWAIVKSSKVCLVQYSRMQGRVQFEEHFKGKKVSKQ